MSPTLIVSLCAERRSQLSNISHFSFCGDDMVQLLYICTQSVLSRCVNRLYMGQNIQNVEGSIRSLHRMAIWHFPWMLDAHSSFVTNLLRTNIALELYVRKLPWLSCPMGWGVYPWPFHVHSWNKVTLLIVHLYSVGTAEHCSIENELIDEVLADA